MDLSEEFPLQEEMIYLNHAAVAPWPRRTAEVVKRFAEENATWGASRYAHWGEVEDQLREQFRTLLNAPSADDIALLKNTSEALSVVAHGLPWEAGDNVVISDEEFPSNRVVWESLRQYGVEVRKANLHGASSPEEALLAKVDGRTRVLSVSSIEYASGIRLDLTALGRYCRKQGIRFCVDAIQSMGAVPLDVQAIEADFVMADGHKWMLGPEGVAVFYCPAERRDELKLRQFGWHMTEHYHDFDREDWTVAHSARRFECGSPNMLGIHALNASLSLLLEVGMDTVERRVTANGAYLLERLSANRRAEIVTPTETGRFGGIVTFKYPHTDQTALFRYLREQQGVICAQRGGGIRLSPHFYTTRDTLDRALAALESYPD